MLPTGKKKESKRHFWPANQNQIYRPHFNGKLEKNGAYEQRFARSFAG